MEDSASNYSVTEGFATMHLLVIKDSLEMFEGNLKI
jgi:hypothetical protein